MNSNKIAISYTFRGFLKCGIPKTMGSNMFQYKNCLILDGLVWGTPILGPLHF